MADVNLPQMADILPLLIEPQSQSNHLFLIIIPLIIGFIYFIWRYYHQPLQKLSRQLQNGTLEPAEVAYQLSQVSGINKELRSELNKIRFSSQPLDKLTLLIFIQKVKHAK